MTSWKDRLSGRFIVLDGPDGSGKSTQLRLLGEFLGGQGIDVVTTRDPGGTVIGDRIREILLDRAHTEMAIVCEILLYMASRAQLWAEVIQPALRRGACVLSDRWVSSTVAYQVAEGTATAEQVMDIYHAALPGVAPDLTLVLDIDPKLGLDRAANRETHDRMEAKGLAFHQRVRERFLDQARRQGDRSIVIDSAGAPEDVAQRLRDALTQTQFIANASTR